ncbi:hypothetical protein CRUP_009581 [Coryphaenoides rupestris]|nr:hypothetical protein CRUP_009581 [Coryphaenoides rupestris]
MARLSLPTATSTKLVCHMTNWAQYRPSSGKFTADNIDPFLCTHVVYALVTINSFNQVTPIEWNDEQQYKTLHSLKDINPALSNLLSVGGTVNGMSPFIPMVARPESRAVFIMSAISYLRKNNFDGLNLDWEFPGQMGSMPTDRSRFSELQTLLLSNPPSMAHMIHLDFVNVMTYDYHGHWEARTAHNSPLYSSNLDSGSHIHHNIVCSFIAGATVEWIPEQEVPYATNGFVWAGYDNEQSFTAKVQWMNSMNLGGAHVWTLDMDDFTGFFCSAGPYPLPTTTPRPTTTRDPLTAFCSGRPNGLYENIADKTTYLQCFNGITYLHRCQPGLIYSDSCKPNKGKFTPQNVDPFLCTHLIYAFSIINNKNELVTYEWNDNVLYKAFNGLKTKYELVAAYAAEAAATGNKQLMLTAAVQYMKDNKFGGAFVWALDLDDFKGDFCGEGSHPLLAHLRKLINSGKSNRPPVPSTTTSKPVVTPVKPTTTKPVRPTVKPTTTAKPVRPTTAVPSTKTTLPIPGRGFCKGKPDGIYANPEDRNAYYMCSRGLTYLRHCGIGTVYDDSCKCCTWP